MKKRGVNFNDRVLAGKVRGLALTHLKKILDPKYKDKAYQKAVLLKLAPTLLPRLNEVTGEGGEPLQVSFDGAFSPTKKSKAAENAIVHAIT